MKNIFTLASLLVLALACGPKEIVPFQDGLEKYPVLEEVLENPDKYKVQILYTQLDRNEHGIPLMTEFPFNLDDERYFYPASTVKLPVAILALEWLEEQNIEGLDANTTMLTDSIHPSQVPAYVDLSAEDSLPSIAQYIKKILLVSDNDAYNRLYELLGQDYINSKLAEKGMNHTVINHRLSFRATPEENRMFNPIRFVNKDGELIHEIPARTEEKVYSNSAQPIIGKAYYLGDSLIEEGMDFTFKNKFAISDLSGTVKRIMFPMAFPDMERFNINEEHRNLILKYMSMLPGESDYPNYPVEEYWDTYSKFYLDGNDKRGLRKSLRLFNKTGQAYGHLLDGSYYVDFDNGIEFFVAAVIYVNEDETLNDDVYEYEEIAFPFFAELGDYLYDIEMSREKLVPADFSEFWFEY
ncbi:serine hydrolase [Algoriphagus sediminis]|uniref:Serine hydrolase n=1 Tax=Algoriphagus sediminis TaxID=3057113 RepID=A0ABT7YBJ7_9BACT|nr:serine hydrolase [Algoriphagus sediminis]MDN3203877.1 serine hydrolase [Algoriphagus sediminis]